MIYAIVHADKEWGIGKNNDMMFSLPKDMKFFFIASLFSYSNIICPSGLGIRYFSADIVITSGQVSSGLLFRLKK